MRTTALRRPTGPAEPDLVRASGMRARPPRLPGQPLFYPVLNEDYAIRVARDWNVTHDGAGRVARFAVDADVLARCPVRQAGGVTILARWVPAEDPPEFRAYLFGPTEAVRGFHAA